MYFDIIKPYDFSIQLNSFNVDWGFMTTVSFIQWRNHRGGKGGQTATPDSEKFCQKSGKRGKIGKNSGKIGEKEEKSGRKGKNRKVSFTLPLLTDRTGYATAFINIENLHLPELVVITSTGSLYGPFGVALTRNLYVVHCANPLWIVIFLSDLSPLILANRTSFTSKNW